MTRLLTVAALCLTAMFVLVACKDETRTGYIELTGRVFIFNPRVATATYVVTLGVVKALPDGAKVEALFENPAGGEKIKVEKAIHISTRNIAIESPSLLCIKKGRRYAFHVVLRSANDEILQTLASSIESTLDQSIMPEAPLVVGPGYQPNPALKGNAAGKLQHRPQQNCPA